MHVFIISGSRLTECLGVVRVAKDNLGGQFVGQC